MTTARPLLRIARRSLLRDRFRASLIVALIALPIAGMIAAAALLGSAFTSSEERATEIMGSADLAIVTAEPVGADELPALLPRGSSVQPVWRSDDRALLAGTRPSVEIRFADVDGLAAGQLRLIDGRSAESVDEAAISTHLSEAGGVGIDQVLSLETHGDVRVVGLIEDPRGLLRDIVLRPPEAAAGLGLTPVWLTELPEDATADRVARSLAKPAHGGGQGGPVPVMDAISRADLSEGSGLLLGFILLLGVLALVQAGLVSAAAFTVGLRRRQRELGLLGAVGASGRQLAGSVLAEGLMAGLVAVVIGIVVGVGLAWLIGLRLDDLVNERTGGIDIDPLIVVAAAMVGLGAALAAAALPAWSAAREPTLVALSGRRPPATPARRLLLLGLGLIAICIVCTIGVPLASVALRGSMYWPVVFTLMLGAVAGVLGIGACSPWLLERLDRPARHLPLPLRIAFRDTARARTRNGPIVTAILASVAAAIAVAAIAGSSQVHTERTWNPPMAADALLVEGVAAEAAARAIASELEALEWGLADENDGVRAAAGSMLVRLDHDVSASDLDQAARVASAIGGETFVEGPLAPPDPMSGFRLFVLAVSLAAAITVTGVAVALGEVESRPEQRTLLVLGAERGLRKRITAARGTVMAVLAGVLAVPAGLLPVFGLLSIAGWPVVIPLPEILVGLVILPVIATAGGLLLGRPLPDWDDAATPRG